MRIDHFLVSDELKDKVSSCEIAREFRKGEKPSDHVPLLIETSAL
jgi:exodeoxyribonuclease-3